MPIAIDGSGTITGISAGGLPDSSITAAELASGAVTQVKLASGVAGTGPVFSAACNAGTNCNTATFTKIFFQVEEFDSNNCYDTSNSRFTPNVAGYYAIIARQQWTSSVGTNENFLAVYKNGFEYKRGVGSSINMETAIIVYMNGSTDYIEIYAFQSSGGTVAVQGVSTTYSLFAGSMVRSA